jgi:hypothetical protein
MAIDKEIFAQYMALLTERIGRTLSPPVYAEYYRALDAELTTEQFMGAATLAFRTWPAEYRNWPSPQQLVELIRPVAAPALSAADAFEQVLEIANRHLFHERFATRRADIQAIGVAALRAFNAAGGFRDLQNAPIDQVPWLRKRFVDAYTAACEHADAERDATLALEVADERMRQLVASTAGALPTVRATVPQKRIAGGGR